PSRDDSSRAPTAGGAPMTRETGAPASAPALLPSPAQPRRRQRPPRARPRAGRGLDGERPSREPRRQGARRPRPAPAAPPGRASARARRHRLRRRRVGGGGGRPLPAGGGNLAKAIAEAAG